MRRVARSTATGRSLTSWLTVRTMIGGGARVCASPLAVLAAEEAKWAALLGESRSWRTNQNREIRHKTLHVAQSRMQNRLEPPVAQGRGGI